MRIRELTNGQKSLMDFLHQFHGGAANGPELKPYGLDDIVSTLNDIAPFDWAGLLRTRVYELQPELSQEAFALAGWRLVYNDTPNPMEGKVESGPGNANLMSSLGLYVNSNGSINDVVPDTPADKALLCPDSSILAVNGTKFSVPAIIQAVKETPRTKTLKLTISFKDSVKDVIVEYSGGLRYPHLVRDDNHVDRLPDLLKPLAK
jgi:predicted metalloprotease with PDZ domain